MTAGRKDFLRARIRALEDEAYDRLLAWAMRDGFSFNQQARRDARLVCSSLLLARVERDEQTRLADSAFGKSEQYLQAANVSGEIIEEQRRRIERLEALLWEAEDKLTYANDSSRWFVGFADLVERIRAALPSAPTG